MTRKGIIFTDGSGRRFVTPEFNGDKAEFEQFKLDDTCTAEWADIMKLFDNVSTLDEFKQANISAQKHYISQMFPDAEPVPAEELTGGEVTADEIIYIGGECSIDHTGSSSTRFRMPGELIYNKTIDQFYESVAQQMGADSSEVVFDCTKILISANIQAKIFEAYELQYPDAFRRNPEGLRTEANTLMVCRGPKVEKTLPDNTVIVQDGFLTTKAEPESFSADCGIETNAPEQSAAGLDVTPPTQETLYAGTPEEAAENTSAHRNYRTLMKLMPEVIEGKYHYIKYQAGGAFMPLVFEHLSGSRYSLMHYYMRNGDMMRDPDMELVIDREKHTANAMTFTQHPYIHQAVQYENSPLQRELNSFLAQWLKNIEEQEYEPDTARFHNEFSDITEKVFFNSDRKPYTVHMGHMGNGLTVWNILEEVRGDYKRIAHINADRSVKYYDDKLPPAVKEIIEKEARTSQMTVSATQDMPVFITPPQLDEQE